MRFLLVSSTLALLVAGSFTRAAAADTGIEFFEKKVRPILVENCYSCHSIQSGKHKGGLLLDSREGIRKGGESGAALVPGKPDDSLILKAVRHLGDAPKMPPTGRLADGAAASLETWIKMGAPDPRTTADRPINVTWEEILRQRRGWWSLQPVAKPRVPAVKNVSCPSRQPVDQFLLAKLEEAGLTFAEPADRPTLIRRLSLVLTGLPPTPEETETFLGDAAANAAEKLVDRLLASPHFGERWARHWLDLVRFSETHGNEWNYEVHHAWRYRDYLIRAFNADVPYDRLVREHVAGDLLAPRWNAAESINEAPIGTAFYRFGEVNHDDCITLPQIGYDLADNQIDTLSKAFAATTVACARCHDHKLDAVSMKDYYGLLGILRSARQVSHTIDAPEVNAAPLRRLRELKAALRREIGEAWLREARDVGRYLQAARARRLNRPDAARLAEGLDRQRLDQWVAALKADKLPLEDPLSPWRTLTGAEPADLAAAWRGLAERYATEAQARAAKEKQYETFADFRSGRPACWQVDGLGLRQEPGRCGDFVVHSDGDALIRMVLPAGCFTHVLSEKLNGALRSPVLATRKKRVSFQVMGRRSSAVRLVSNNCQLNYTNYRALTSDALGWVTFSVPEESQSLRTYAELMTMLDNPKFPDQLSGLGGDPANYKLPWEQAAADPRSFFGVTRVVLHDEAGAPPNAVSHVQRLFAGAAPATLDGLAQLHGEVVEAAVRAWAMDRPDDDDVRWLEALRRRGLLGNTIRLTPRVEKLAADYRAVEKQLSLPRIVPGLADGGAGIEQPVFTRGDCLRPGAPTARRYLEVLSRPGDRFAPTGSGRLELADRIAAADNPLTARVMVNRIWQHLFGAGIVRSVDDFGHVGELPSHPELLDYLAARYVEDGWSTKRLIRSLVLTRAFQASSRPSAPAREIDPRNRLLQHFSARRLEAEAIRDSILAASGRLEPTLYGPSVQPYRDGANPDRRLFPGPLDGNGRRSIYVKNNLMEGPKFLSAFNFPGGKVMQGRRDLTNVPSQALALLNDPFVVGQADVWAEKLVARPDVSVAARVERAFQAALGRAPEPSEIARLENTVRALAELRGVPPEDVLKSREVWKHFAHALFNLAEFIYVR